MKEYTSYLGCFDINYIILRNEETNGETILMPKLSIVFSMMSFTFPTNTMITNGMNFLNIRHNIISLKSTLLK
jgi:hypothetical protein